MTTRATREVVRGEGMPLPLRTRKLGPQSDRQALTRRSSSNCRLAEPRLHNAPGLVRFAWDAQVIPILLPLERGTNSSATPPGRFRVHAAGSVDQQGSSAETCCTMFLHRARAAMRSLSLAIRDRGSESRSPVSGAPSSAALRRVGWAARRASRGLSVTASPGPLCQEPGDVDEVAHTIFLTSGRIPAMDVHVLE